MTDKKIVDERFKFFGSVAFTATTKVNDFIDYMRNNKVVGTKCTFCNKYYFPPRADCCNCLSSNMDWFNISNKVGNLITYSKLKFAPKGFEADLPYSIALLDFGICKVFGRLDNCIDSDDITIGMSMKIAVKNSKTGQITFVFQKA